MSRFARLDVNVTGTGGFSDALESFLGMPARAQVRAVRTLSRRIKTEARRDIQAEYNLKAARITKGLRVRDTDDGVAVIGSSRGINAISFGAKWSASRRGKSRKGAYFTYKRGATKTPQDGSFIATGRNGNQLVFERQGKARLPLVGVYGPSVAQMLKHARRPERLADFAVRTLAAEVERLLERERQKAAAKAARSATK